MADDGWCGPWADDAETAKVRGLFIERTEELGQYRLNRALREGCYGEIWRVLDSPRYRPHRREIVAAGFAMLSSAAAGEAVAELVEWLAGEEGRGRVRGLRWTGALDFAVYLPAARAHGRLAAAVVAGELCRFLAEGGRPEETPRAVQFVATAAGREAVLVDVLSEGLRYLPMVMGTEREAVRVF